MVSHTVYFKGMMVFTLTSQMYHIISVLVPVLVRVPEYLSTSMSTSTSTMTLELRSTSAVWVPEIQYSSTASTSTEYEYPSPEYSTIGSWLPKFVKQIVDPSCERNIKSATEVIAKFLCFEIFRLGSAGELNICSHCYNVLTEDWAFWPPQGQNWANTDQNETVPGGGQDTSACHIWSLTFHAFSLECLETPISLSFLATSRVSKTFVLYVLSTEAEVYCPS